MRKLILIKHSRPEIVPALPASQWRLSQDGRLRCRRLAQKLAVHDPAVIVASLEPKAIETGRIVADHLGRPLETSPDLHEHDRREVKFVQDRNEFQRLVARLFQDPDKLVFGSETADQAHERFARAVASVIERFPGGNLALVSHGTVITLFVSRAVGAEPIRLWKRLDLPAFVVLSLPDLSLLKVVGSV
jgi:broad specificity phosphatase PhoE